MAYTTIDDPSEYFHTQIYTGNGSAPRDITNDANSGDFQPDWVWIKNRDSGGNNHHLFTSSQPGSGYVGHLSTDLTTAEASATNKVIALNSDGFRLGGTHSSVNANNDKYVAWQWIVNGGSASASGTESGLNAAYSRQTNSTAGISIITYTGLGTSGTGSSPVVPHGLGAVPDMLIIKNRTSNSTDWAIWFKVYNSGGTNVFQGFNNNAFGGSAGASHFGDVAPDSTNVSLGATPGSGDTASVRTNTDGENYVMYAFKSIRGYSQFGAYTGNGNANGTFINLGFKPQFIIIKRADSTGSFFICDSVRDTRSLGYPNTQGSAKSQHAQLFGEATDAESTYNSTAGDFLSNGYRLRGTNASTNNNGGDYVYMAFAEHPFVSSEGVPTTAL